MRFSVRRELKMKKRLKRILLKGKIPRQEYMLWKKLPAIMELYSSIVLWTLRKSFLKKIIQATLSTYMGIMSLGRKTLNISRIFEPKSGKKKSLKLLKRKFSFICPKLYSQSTSRNLTFNMRWANSIRKLRYGQVSWGHSQFLRLW